MNMGVPETPLSPLDNIAQDHGFLRDRQPDIIVTGNNIPVGRFRGTKRRWDDASWRAGNGHANQPRVTRTTRRRIRHSFSEEPPNRRLKSGTLGRTATGFDAFKATCSHGASDANCDSDTSSSPLFASEHSIVPGLRHTDLREVIRYIINDALKVGGRPDSAIAEETEYGERIEVRSRCSNGQANIKYIEWMVSPDVPDTILIDEKDLAKTVSCVILNAIKFTANGDISLQATLSAQARYIVINVKDSGSGIPAAFLPYLFHPFSREDNSTTRESEGLGLGLMVAKGLARKLGGDLYCIRSDVSGPHKGSEFEMRVPLKPGEVCSRPASPRFGSPTPSARSRQSTDHEAPSSTGAQQPTTPPLGSDPYKNNHEAYVRATTSATSKLTQSLHNLGIPPSPCSPGVGTPARRRPASSARAFSDNQFNRNLAKKYPLNFLVVEDNKINRKLLVAMLAKLGYTNVVEAYDGNNAVEQMRKSRSSQEQIDVVLMDLWMPLLDGFQATEAILKMDLPRHPIFLAVSADITVAAIARAEKVGMKGFLTKPFQIRDLEKVVMEYCAIRDISAMSQSL